MQKSIFDARRRVLIKSRAERGVANPFLLDRAFAGMLDQVSFNKDAVVGIVGRHRPDWLDKFAAQGSRAFIIDPETIEYGTADQLAEDRTIGDLLGQCSHVLSFGLLDHCNDPKLAAFLLGHLLAPDGILVGSIVGGESLAFLRDVLLAMDRSNGKAAARFHPMMDGQSLAALLGDAGLQKIVVDIDRLTVRYRDLYHLASDLRGMGCSRALASPQTPILPSSWRRAVKQTQHTQVEERFDLINFIARKVDG